MQLPAPEPTDEPDESAARRGAGVTRTAAKRDPDAFGFGAEFDDDDGRETEGPLEEHYDGQGAPDLEPAEDTPEAGPATKGKRKRRRRRRKKAAAGEDARAEADARDDEPSAADGVEVREPAAKKAKAAKTQARKAKAKKTKAKKAQRKRRGADKPRDVDLVPRHRDRRGKVEVIEPPALDLSAFDVELDPKRVPTFGTIVEGRSRPKRRTPRVPEDGLDDYKPPPPPGSDAPPPPPRDDPDDPDTFGDW